MAAAGKLSGEAKIYIVQALACCDPPSIVVEAVRREFGVVITRQTVERYDPTKKAGRALSGKWRELFEATREEYFSETTEIAISHRATRLRALQRMVDKAEKMGNLQLAAQLLEQAAKEMGGAYTNLRKLGNPDGKPIRVQPTAPTMTPKEAAAAYAATLAGGVSSRPIEPNADDDESHPSTRSKWPN